MGKIFDLLDKFFASPWIAIGTGAGCVAVIFIVFFCISCHSGDFVYAKKAIKQIAAGRVEDGLDALKNTLAHSGFSKSKAESDGLDYDMAVLRPYSYSAVKILPRFAQFLSLLFMFLISVGLMFGMDDTRYSFFALVAILAEGLFFSIIAGLVSRGMLKKTAKSFGRAQAAMDGFFAAERNTNANRDEDAMPAEVLSLCARIEEVALDGGANHRVLSGLYSEIKYLQGKFDSYAVQQKLLTALDVLSILIDSALDGGV